MTPVLDITNLITKLQINSKNRNQRNNKINR